MMWKFTFCLFLYFQISFFLFSQDLDPDFGDSGIFSNSIGSFTMEAAAVATQSDGKILLGGSRNMLIHHRYLTRQEMSNWWISRLDKWGKTDSSFGKNGELIISHDGQRRKATQDLN